MIADNAMFSEWYHYLFLAAGLIILLSGLKYFPKIDKKFRLKSGVANQSKRATGFMLTAFIIGFVMFFMQTFFTGVIPAHFVIYTGYGVFAAILLMNAYTCFKNYTSPGSVIRMIILSILIVIYFYSGLLGGLLIVAVLLLAILIYAFLKFKKILTIK